MSKWRGNTDTKTGPKGLFWFIDAIIICDRNRNMALQEAIEEANAALIQLLEQYDANLLREDRV